MYQYTPSEPSIKMDNPEDQVHSEPARSDFHAPGRQSILRKSQIDAIRESGPAEEGLPPEKGFPIQIGPELFRLSGASIMSDAPSYFSKFFEEQLRKNEDGGGGVRTLYIDRDPSTFQDIARHLQGYHVQPRDGGHYVRIFADAQFYSLPRLIQQLFESEIYIQIGDQNFQIPRDIFSSPGDSPNYFSLGFAAFFNSPQEAFLGLAPEGLLRPPSILPPSVQGRSAKTFSELLHLLRGYPLHIRHQEHRSELLRDCRYFHLRGLEQRLIPHNIAYNPIRLTSEITIRLADIRQSGVSFIPSNIPSNSTVLPTSSAGWVNYARPFVDESPAELVLEIADDATILDLQTHRASFSGTAKARITSLFQVVANKMNLPTQLPLGLMLAAGGAAAQAPSPGNTPLSDDRVKIYLGPETHVILDGEAFHHLPSLPKAASLPTPSAATPSSNSGIPPSQSEPPIPPQAPQSQLHSALSIDRRKRKRGDSLHGTSEGDWVVRKGLWRLRVQPRAGMEEGRMEIVMHAVKLEAYVGEKGRNVLRGFVS